MPAKGATSASTSGAKEAARAVAEERAAEIAASKVAEVQQKRLDRGSAALEKLRNDGRRRKQRDGWESIIRELDAAVRLAPATPLAAQAALLSGKARVGLFEASRSPDDAKAALAALRKVDDDFGGALGREALVAAVQVALHTKDAGDRVAAARRLAERYPESPEGKHWAARLGVKITAPAVVAPKSKTAPVTVGDEDEDEQPGAAEEETAAAAPAREPEVDVGHEAAKVIEQMIADARAPKGSEGRATAEAGASVKPAGEQARAEPSKAPAAAGSIAAPTSEPAAKELPGKSGAETAASEGSSANEAEDDLPEAEEAEAPAPKSGPILRAVKDAVARLTEPDEEPASAAKARELRSAALSSGSLAAQLGLKVRRVVVDAGHGGKDTGAIGPKGLREKDAALSIAKKVAARLKAAGFDVIMTRSSDVFVSLEERTRIANEAKADLFVSVHCNAARQRKLSGVETWTLNVASNRYAARLAAFENAEAERTVSELRMILADLATKANAGDARELAQSVQSSLVRTLKAKTGKMTDHGVKQALFYVLLGTHMPSILVETGFISNPSEEQKLKSAKFQEGTADAIASGVKDFVDGRRKLARAP